MKKIKQLSALILAFMLTLTLVSCGGEESSESAVSAPASEAASQATSEATSESTSEAASEVTSEAASEEASEAASEEVSEATSEETSEENAPLNDYIGKAVYGTPALDAAEPDALWDTTPEYAGETIRPSVTLEDTYTRFTFKLMWDEEHLYLLEKVTDLTIGEFDPSRTFENDSTEICLSVNGSNSAEFDFNNNGWFGISPHEIVYHSDYAKMFGEDLEYVEYTSHFDETGYIICVAYDIKSIAPDLNWGAGHRIGFEISVNDSKDAQTRACCIGWADSTDQAHLNPSLWGSIYLVQDKDAAIPA